MISYLASHLLVDRLLSFFSSFILSLEFRYFTFPSFWFIFVVSYIAHSLFNKQWRVIPTFHIVSVSLWLCSNSNCIFILVFKISAWTKHHSDSDLARLHWHDLIWPWITSHCILDTSDILYSIVLHYILYHICKLAGWVDLDLCTF
jgi:hypothetical protein